VEWFRKGTALNNAAAQNGLGYVTEYRWVGGALSAAQTVIESAGVP
jgi:hypothetical protein